MSSRIAVFAVALLVIGCGSPEPAETSPSATTAPSAPVDVGLTKVSYEEWIAELESMEGSIVVVDLWATWCAPCIERFPKMVEMADRYAEERVRFVSLSLDDRDDESTVAQVTEFLRTNDASRLSNYLMDEIIPDAFEKLDLLGVPAVYVYDGSGQLRFRLTGDDPNDQFTDADVEEAIRELLEERSSRGEERET